MALQYHLPSEIRRYPRDSITRLVENHANSAITNTLVVCWL